MNKWKDQYRTEGFIVGVLVGAAVAALSSLLLAPKSGRELREDIGETTNKALDQANNYLDVARKKGHEVAEDVEEQASAYFDVASKEAEKATKKTKGFFNKESKKFDNKIKEVAQVSKDMNKK